MGLSPEERERRLAERERAVVAEALEAKRLLTAARAAHATADRERNRARQLAGRLARKLRHTLATAREQLDADRAALDARTARFTEAQSEFHTASAADRDRLRAAWADLAARQRRLASEYDETNRFHAEQAAALDARAAELGSRAKAEADARTKLQRQAAALREEVAALDERARNTQQLLEELEQRRAELRAEVLAPPAPASGAEPPFELRVALDRAADRDLGAWAAELTAREEKLHLDRAALATLSATVKAEKATLADRRRVLAEQFAQLAAARAQWQEAERVTVAEMEQLAHTLRRREAEQGARAERLGRADARRREDAYDLWQLQLRLEAWQSKLVACETRWHTEREQTEADLARRESVLVAAADPDALPFAVSEGAAVPAELAALRDELERMAVVLMEMELPEPPESQLPWGAEEPREPAAPASTESDPDVLLFDRSARAA